MKSRKGFPLIGTLLAAGIVAKTAFGAPYSYDPASKRDPFRPMPLNESSLSGIGLLEQFDVRELRLAGTLLGLEPSALLITPTNDVIIAHVGDRMGRRGGYLMTVTRTGITVREPVNGRSTNRSLAEHDRHRDIELQIQEMPAAGGSAGGTAKQPAQEEPTLFATPTPWTPPAPAPDAALNMPSAFPSPEDSASVNPLAPPPPQTPMSPAPGGVSVNQIPQGSLPPGIQQPPGGNP